MTAEGISKLQDDFVVCESFLKHCAGFVRDSFEDELVLKDDEPEKHIIDGAHRTFLLKNMYDGGFGDYYDDIEGRDE